MQTFSVHTGVAAPLPRADVNTDDIIPARFLKTVLRTGLATGLFGNWRFRGDDRTPDPAFVLNQPRYQGASILVTGENFGCGSSREHAPWALSEYGIRCVIAPSFADIFHNNCFNSGILPIVLTGAEVAALLSLVSAPGAGDLVVNLPRQTVTATGRAAFPFDIDGFRKAALLAGLDNVDWTLSHETDIQAYEIRRRGEAPWLFAEAY